MNTDPGRFIYSNRRCGLELRRYYSICPEAEYNRKSSMAVVTGGIMLKTKEDTLTGESGTFNFKSKTGIVNDAGIFIKDNNFHIRGGRIEKFGDDSYLIRDFKITTCDGDKT
jgi:lipopolysaccharide assembly outer membrane protein LptD (OstA)